MIRHCVLVRARADREPGELEAVFAGLAALGRRLPGLQAFAGGADVSPEGLQRGYTHAFTIDFADETARDAYLVDAGHPAPCARLRDTAEGGRDGILVLDFES